MIIYFTVFFIIILQGWYNLKVPYTPDIVLTMVCRAVVVGLFVPRDGEERVRCRGITEILERDTSARQRGAVRRSAEWCGAVQCGAVRCGAVQCGAVRCGAMRCSAVRCERTFLLRTPRHIAMTYNGALGVLTTPLPPAPRVTWRRKGGDHSHHTGRVQGVWFQTDQTSRVCRAYLGE